MILPFTFKCRPEMVWYRMFHIAVLLRVLSLSISCVTCCLSLDLSYFVTFHVNLCYFMFLCVSLYHSLPACALKCLLSLFCICEFAYLRICCVSYMLLATCCFLPAHDLCLLSFPPLAPFPSTKTCRSLHQSFETNW